jgi:hypothetical protein
VLVEKTSCRAAGRARRAIRPWPALVGDRCRSESPRQAQGIPARDAASAAIRGDLLAPAGQMRDFVLRDCRSLSLPGRKEKKPRKMRPPKRDWASEVPAAQDHDPAAGRVPARGRGYEGGEQQAQVPPEPRATTGMAISRAGSFMRDAKVAPRPRYDRSAEKYPRGEVH